MPTIESGISSELIVAFRRLLNDEHAGRRPHHPEQDLVAGRRVGRHHAARGVMDRDVMIDEEDRHDHVREHTAEHHAGVDAKADDHAGADRQQAVREADAEVREDHAVDDRDELAVLHDLLDDLVHDPRRIPAFGQERQQVRIVAHEHQDARCGHTDHHGVERGGRGALHVGGRVARRIEHDDRLGGREAVDERQLLVDDEVTAQRHGEQDAERARGGQPQERLLRRQRHGEQLGPAVAQDVERAEQHAHERGLRRASAGRFREVVLPAVVASARQHLEEQEAEERGDDRDVRSEAELEHHVRVRGAHHDRDEHAGDDRRCVEAAV
jgi:hypothetical protein